MRRLILLLALALSTAVVPEPLTAQARDCSTPSARAGRYAEVNGLRMYYEVHGTGRPLVLIHGALTTIQSSFGKILPTLACTRQVIAVELQAHGRTADIARPFSNENSADDVAALLRHLGIQEADILGYSMGGSTAIRIATRHPSLVRKLVVISTGFDRSGLTPELQQFMASIDPENAPWAESFKTEFQQVAPRPNEFSRLLQRVKESVSNTRDVTVEQLGAIQAPTLIIAGDRDIMPLDHLVRFFRALPHGQLAIYPGTDHFPGMVDRADWQLAMIPGFLDAPLPARS
jgi:pimeloyl-ACP methyl ester carboxylesterase